MAEPIIEFKDEAQAYECLKEWQARLFLDDWIIKLVLLDEFDMPENDCMGHNHYFSTIKACKISIKKINHIDKDCLEKPCHELILIHELLHCKPWLSHYVENKDSPELCYVEQMEHTMLEQFAKSLLMAKYDLTFDWFKNF